MFVKYKKAGDKCGRKHVKNDRIIIWASVKEAVVYHHMNSTFRLLSNLFSSSYMQ